MVHIYQNFLYFSHSYNYYYYYYYYYSGLLFYLLTEIITFTFTLVLIKEHFLLISSYQLNAQFLYSITIYMLHYNPRHVSSSTMLIFRKSNCIITASGIVTLCKRPYNMPVESGLQSGIMYGRLQRVTIPETVIIQFVPLKMSKVLLETC